MVRGNPCARNDVRSAKTEVKWWFSSVDGNPFAWNDVRRIFIYITWVLNIIAIHIISSVSSHLYHLILHAAFHSRAIRCLVRDKPCHLPIIFLARAFGLTMISGSSGMMAPCGSRLHCFFVCTAARCVVWCGGSRQFRLDSNTSCKWTDRWTIF